METFNRVFALVFGIIVLAFIAFLFISVGFNIADFNSFFDVMIGITFVFLGLFTFFVGSFRLIQGFKGC